MVFATICPFFPTHKKSNARKIRKYIVANFNAPDNNCFVTFIRFTFVVEIDGTISNKEVIINDKHILLRIITNRK